MESASATFYLFGKLVAEEKGLYDKRAKTLAFKALGMAKRGKKKARGTTKNRVPSTCQIDYRFREPSLRRRATVGVSSVN